MNWIIDLAPAAIMLLLALRMEARLAKLEAEMRYMMKQELRHEHPRDT